MKYLDLMKKRIDGIEENVPWKLGYKNYVRGFGDVIGIQTPKIYQTALIENIKIDEIPADFVLKPSFASASIGVRLFRRNDSLFYDIVRGTTHTWSEIVESFIEVCKLYPKASEYNCIIEELLYDHEGNTPPEDIRFYCFQGEIGLIHMDEHLKQGKPNSSFFHGDFESFPDLFERFKIAEKAAHLENIIEASLPKGWKELLTVAKRVSVAIPSPFARVDLYDTPKGIYLGEITLTPGTFYYKDRKIMSDSEDERLGKMWLDSEKRMIGSRYF